MTETMTYSESAKKECGPVVWPVVVWDDSGTGHVFSGHVWEGRGMYHGVDGYALTLTEALRFSVKRECAL